MKIADILRPPLIIAPEDPEGNCLPPVGRMPVRPSFPFQNIPEFFSIITLQLAAFNNKIMLLAVIIKVPLLTNYNNG